MVQVPSTHAEKAFCAEHWNPHAPQLFALLDRLISQPSEAMPLQLAKPVLQEATAQAPELQAETPLAAAHTMPQPPQLFGLDSTFTSQPSPGEALQST